MEGLLPSAVESDSNGFRFDLVAGDMLESSGVRAAFGETSRDLSARGARVETMRNLTLPGTFACDTGANVSRSTTPPLGSLRFLAGVSLGRIIAVERVGGSGFPLRTIIATECSTLLSSAGVLVRLECPDVGPREKSMGGVRTDVGIIVPNGCGKEKA